MRYAICTVPAAPVRKEDSHRTEMTNQLLFGECMELLEEKEEWLKIRSVYDQYEGWLTKHLVSEIDEGTAKTSDRFIAAELINPVQCSGQFMHIPLGSALKGFDPGSKQLWKPEWQYEGKYHETTKGVSVKQLIETAGLWLNAPYLWGGKTLMGVDCSGFVQTVFKLYGIKLLRDAYQQAEQGLAIDRSEASEGDLAFFHNEKGRVTHVGIVLNNDQIIHASGKVRIDSLDQVGITNKENRKQTHVLHSIRRVVPTA